MPRIQTPKKIRTEDFPSDDQELIDKVGYAFNSFADEVYQTLNGGIDNTNLNQQISIITVNLNASGALVNAPQIKLESITSKVNGVTVIRAVNQVNPGVYPTSQPFVSYSINGRQLTIINISGLQNGSQYQLTLKIE